MQQWFSKTIDKYTKQIILFCVFLLIVFAFYNFLTNNKGSYVNYDETIKLLFKLPFDPTSSSVKSYNTGGGSEFQSKGERECKRSIEEITHKPFTKHRPDFLKNEITGKNLELDCYNEELKLAIEYNGIQHYEYTPIFHKSKDVFYNTKYRDKMKDTLCRENGVKLIVVPYTVKLENIQQYILDKIKNFSN